MPIARITNNSPTLKIRNDTPSGTASSSGRQSVVLNTVDSIAGNGTWVLTDDAKNLTLDNVTFITNKASLKFDLDATVGNSDGIIMNSTMQAVNLRSFLNQGTFFFPMYFPSGSAVLALVVDWGSSLSNYYETGNVTKTSSGDAFQDGWNTISVPWTSDIAPGGSPDPTAINYFGVFIAYNGVTQTGLRLGQVTIQGSYGDGPNVKIRND